MCGFICGFSPHYPPAFKRPHDQEGSVQDAVPFPPLYEVLIYLHLLILFKEPSRDTSKLGRNLGRNLTSESSREKGSLERIVPRPWPLHGPPNIHQGRQMWSG